MSTRVKNEFRVKTVISDQNRAHRVNTGQTMSTRVKNKFRVKTVISDQNRAHRVRTGQTMSTRVKNEFRVVSGQNRHFRPKPSSLGQYGSNHVDQGKKWVSGCFGSKTVIFDHNPVHRVDTHQMFFLIFYFFFCGWNRLFLILIWIFNFTYINIYYYI